MDQEKFGVLLPYISESLVAMIAEKQKISELDAVNELYGSQRYGLLDMVLQHRHAVPSADAGKRDRKH